MACVRERREAPRRFVALCVVGAKCEARAARVRPDPAQWRRRAGYI